ncbi:hypothetical protein GCM10009854_00550 [Saccharopolyspora halophila]|uniref:DUF2127 domain-containing protein n=1 Tax=Saccharopolyspora halophila TaxID=405551 RepID=A0ABN3FG83_9PSEU
MPNPLRYAVVLWWVVALLLLLETAAMWSGQHDLIEQLMRTDGLPAGQAEQRASAMLLEHSVFGVLLALAYLASGVLLYQRRAWGRIAMTGFALLHVLMVFATGTVIGVQALLLVLGLVAAVLMWRPASTDWLTGER